MRCALARAGDHGSVRPTRELLILAIHNILADRLERLVEHGILVRVDAGQIGQRYEYDLTEKGEALLPVLTALRDWSDTWVFGKGREPLIVTDRKSGKRIPQLKVLGSDGRALNRRDLRSKPCPESQGSALEAGPGG